MRNSAGAITKSARVFGRRAPEGAYRDPELSAVLDRRLREKISNYERAARKLQVAGQNDAADALVKAACRLRHITTNAP